MSAAAGTQIIDAPVDQPLTQEQMITTPANRCGKCSRDYVADSSGPYYFIGSQAALCRACVEALLPSCELLPVPADGAGSLFRKPGAKAVVRGSRIGGGRK
jgi:hypothetical protein